MIVRTRDPEHGRHARSARTASPPLRPAAPVQRPRAATVTPHRRAADDPARADALAGMLARVVAERSKAAAPPPPGGAAGILQRAFYEKTKEGKYVWHAEAAGPSWRDTKQTTRWLLWSYPVYVSAAPAATGQAPAGLTEVADAPAKKRRKRKKKPRAEDVPESSTPTPPAVIAAGDEEIEEEGEDEETVGAAAVVEEEEQEAEQEALDETAIGDADDADADVDEEEEEVEEVVEEVWETKVSASQKRNARALAIDVPSLTNAVDAYKGAPLGILESFNTLFNALVLQSLATQGTLTSAYRAKSDKGKAFSVAVTLPPLTNWILHVHCRADGKIASGENPTHYKRKSDAGALGVSIKLLDKQIAVLVPDAAARLTYAKARLRF